MGRVAHSLMRSSGTGQPRWGERILWKMPSCKTPLFLWLVLLLPAGVQGARVVTPNVGNTGGSTRLGSAGAVSGSYGAATGGGFQGASSIKLNGSSLIQVNSPHVQADNGVTASLSAVQVGPSQRARALSRESAQKTGAVSSISGESKNAGALTKTGLKTLDATASGLGKARSQEKKGRANAVSLKLDRLFDFSRKKKTGDAVTGVAGKKESDPAGVAVDGTTDVSGLKTDKAVSKLTTLAANAGAAQAPFLYEKAVLIAKESKDPARVGRILKKAAARAKPSVTEAGNKALIAASKGRTTDALRYTRSVHGWNELLSSKERPLIANYPEFKDAVKHVLGEALESPGRTLPVPTVKFEALKNKTGAQMKALVSIPDGMSGQVAALPEQFLANLALPESVVAWDETAFPALGENPLSAQFGLSPQAGFQTFYRRHRAAGGSAWVSFWTAARQYLSAALSRLWQSVRAWVRAILSSMGISQGPASLDVDVSADVYDRLRGAPAETVSLSETASLKRDGHGLGYRLHSP